MKKILVFAVLTSLFLAGCSSFPINESGSDSMLIVPVVFDKSVPGTVFGSLQITIIDASGTKVASRKLSSAKNYEYVELPPGKYTVNEQVFVYDKTNKKFGSKRMNVPFELKPGTITVFPSYLLYNFYTKASVPNTTYMHYEFTPMNESVKENLMTELEENESFSSWKIEFPGM